MPPLLQIEQLDVRFGPVRAVRGLDLRVDEGKTLALVGESGSGKSVTSLAVMRLLEQNAGVTGRIDFGGRDLLALSEKEMRQVRGAQIAMVFQDPMTSLNPVLRVGTQVAEPLRKHMGMNAAGAREEVLRWLARVQLHEPERVYDSFPHQLSGGMRQRIVIAMALCCRPRLVIADEPTTALDVTVQKEVMSLLAELQRELGTAVLLITHDLGVVQEVADDVAVMYAGQIIESGDIFRQTRHPYTWGLLNSIPRLDRPKSRLVPIPGGPPNLAELGAGCSFAARCSARQPQCESAPAWNGQVRCHFPRC